MKVCEKVEKKGVTTYNEVADELVSELSDLQSGLSDFVSVVCFNQKYSCTGFIQTLKSPGIRT